MFVVMQGIGSGKPCPIRYWRADSNFDELLSPGRDTNADPALHFADRLLLYAAAMEPCGQGKAHPVALVLSAVAIRSTTSPS
jgi:hypothetical protein